MRHGWIALGLVVGVSFGGYCSRKPWMEFNDQQAKAEYARLQARKIDLKRAELLETTAQLENPLGMEMTARQLGFYKQGEVKLAGL